MRITQQLSGGEVLTSTTARRVRLYLWLSRVQGRLSEGRLRRTRNPRFPSPGMTASPLFDNPTTGHGNCEYQLWDNGRSDQSAAVGHKPGHSTRRMTRRKAACRPTGGSNAFDRPLPGLVASKARHPRIAIRVSIESLGPTGRHPNRPRDRTYDSAQER